MAKSRAFVFGAFLTSLKEKRFLGSLAGLLLFLASLGSAAWVIGRPGLVWGLLVGTSKADLSNLAQALAPLGAWRAELRGFAVYLPLAVFLAAVTGLALWVFLGTSWLSRKGSRWLSTFGWLVFVPAAGLVAFEGIRLGILLDHALIGATYLGAHGEAAAAGAGLFRWLLLGLLAFGALRWIFRGRFGGTEGAQGAKAPRTWSQVQADERAAILRVRGNLSRSDEPEDWVGLSFSGGGIRSATFNLGLVQALGRRKMLRAVDYLSTVSGGGYLGGWLSKWSREAGGIDRVEEALGGGEEPPQVRFLRRYSNYLTPRKGMFTADTWATVATYIRNAFLNLVILLSGFAAILLLPRILVGFMEPGARFPWLGPVQANLSFLVAAALTAFGTASLVARIPEPQEARSSETPPARQGDLLLRVVLPFGLASVFATHWLFAGQAYFCSHLFGVLCGQVQLGCSGESSKGGWSCWVLLAALGYGVVTLIASRPRSGQKGRLPWLGTAAALVAGAAAGFAFYGLGQAWGFNVPVAGREADLWPILVYGPPTVMGVFTFAGVLHIGLAGRFWTDHQREWLARVGGWQLIFGVAWVVALGTAVYGVPVLLAAGPWVKAGLASGWILTTLGGLMAGRGLQKGGDATRWSKTLVSLGPYVFIGGLLALLSLGLDAGLTKLTAWTSPERGVPISQLWETLQEEVPPAEGPEEVAEGDQEKSAEVGFFRLLEVKAQRHQELLLRQAQGIEALSLFGLLLSLAFIAAHQVDINEFSMHSYYRNRLVRCYLGASNEGRLEEESTADPFTGFDEKDDVGLAELSPQGDSAPRGGPFPVLNTALNLVQGAELAWQTRKAASLVFTPLYCGYEFPPPHRKKGEEGGGFRATGSYGNQSPGWSEGVEDSGTGGITLGTAMAISGAAASPNMGFRTTPTLALLMTIFNVRLGWWVGNPAHPTAWRYNSPRFGLGYLVQELFGLTSDRSAFVYTSDGGHFENLGIYELVRRRCRYIIACDGEQDAQTRFTGLGNALRRCRTDFGAEIEIKVDEIRRGKAHWAVGRVIYEDGTEGFLLYIKASLTCNRDEPEDVLEYKARKEAFPHESTGDQFFDEDQFESYRALGQHIGEELLAALEDSPKASWGGFLEELWEAEKARQASEGDSSSSAQEAPPGEDA